MNLLTDPIFRAQANQKAACLSLPALLAELGQDKVDHLVGIQRHQYDAFHVFLCYLAGAVLVRNASSDPIQNEEFWRHGLSQLTGSAGLDAWQLIGDDDAKPAFMQPPLLGEKRKPTAVITAPDQLDVLITTKNHDLKRMRALEAQTDTWVYSLISFQTMSGFSGRGNYGISRMNSGYGNRAVVELFRSQRLGRRWVDAVIRLLEHRRLVLKQDFNFNPSGLVLTWLKSWDGKTSLKLADLDPFYIEICRRVRLRGGDYIDRVEFYPSKQARIQAKEMNGVVGDPWLPVDLREIGAKNGAAPKALTFPSTGITAEHMRLLLFEQHLQLSSLQKPQPNWHGDLWLSVSVLVRGQGITNGFHDWKIRIPEEKTVGIFSKPSERRALEKLSGNAIEYAALMQNRVLKPAVFSYVLGGPEKLDFSDKFANSVWERTIEQFELRWSEAYFPWLFSVPEIFSEQKELLSWAKKLQKYALMVFKEVEDCMASHSSRWYRSRTEARKRLWGGFYRNFDILRRERSEGSVSS